MAWLPKILGQRECKEVGVAASVQGRDMKERVSSDTPGRLQASLAGDYTLFSLSPTNMGLEPGPALGILPPRL